MPRTRINARRQADSQEVHREEKVRLAQIMMDSALVKIDELGRLYTEQVDSQLKLIRDTTDEQLLQMKWSEFLALKVDRFAHRPDAGETLSRGDSEIPPGAKGPEATTRSRSISQQRGRIRTKQQAWTRVQSVDRAAQDEEPTLSFLRWPRAGELVLSTAGSPLAVQKPLERCANVHIPTSRGVITVKPHKLGQVKREVLMSLDQNALNQVKTLSSNLGKIVEVATKMGKL